MQNLMTRTMSKFMIYNADEVIFILARTLDEAKQWAIMYCDHSDEIIVREVNDIKYKY
jgi:hypothetical protein